MKYDPITDLREDEVGPAMELLDERERAFVRTMIRLGLKGIINLGKAAKDAGYGLKERYAAGGKNKPRNYFYVQGHRLSQNPRIQAAILEESRKRVNLGASIVATPTVIAIAMDKTEKAENRLRAAEMLFNRGGMPALTEHKVTVEHKQPKQMLELAARLAKELDVPLERLVGLNREAQKLIEGEFTEVANADNKNIA